MKSPTRRNRTDELAIAAQHRPARRPRPTASRPLLALLVAGDPEQAELYGLKLRRDGYTVVPATGLERGLELAARVRPDLVFVCLGSWAVPALVLLVLRSDPATSGLPTVLVSDQDAGQLAAALGRLGPHEHIVPRTSAVHVSGERPARTGRPACMTAGHWDRHLTLVQRPPAP
jgi:CheY-like chemotaxis protein